MSLAVMTCCRGECRFPRVSGDEPGGWDWIKDAAEFSPRERG